METYSFLRELADSYVLALLFAFFAVVVVWAFRPGSRALHDDAAQAVFRHDERVPAAIPVVTGCANRCADCTCVARDFLKDHPNG